VDNKPSISRKTRFLLLFLLLQTALFAQTFPRFEPDPKALKFHSLGGRDNSYSWAELAEISLWASGDSGASNLEKIRAAAETLKKSAELPVSDREKAEYILGFMHKNFLKSYSLTQTRVDTIFSNGRFNCVSSAVLYMILCTSAGIYTSGVITKEHAFITVHIGELDVDVETTNPYGFDPGSRKDYNDRFGRVTGFAYVPARNYRDRQTINQIELISVIMNNRIGELEKSNKFAESVPIAADRAALLTGNSLSARTSANSPGAIFTDPQKDLLDRLLNFGSALLRAGKEDDCLRWAETAFPLYPDDERWQEIILAAANNRLMKYTKAGKLEDARVFLAGKKTLLSQANYAALDSTLSDIELAQIDKELAQKINSIKTAAEGEAVINAINQARSNSKVSEKRVGEMLTAAIQKTAEALSAAPARDWRTAAKYMETAIASFGTNREFEKALQIYRSNIAADYHNRFVKAWNSKNIDEAEGILKDGLLEFPDDRQLLADMEMVNKSRQ
jgi:hypothetical protein